MVEQLERADGSALKLNLSFLEKLPENQLANINGAAHLVNHFWDHRHILGLEIEEVAFVLKSSESEITIAKKIIGEMERVGGCPFKDLSQDLVNEEIIGVSSIWSKKFEEMSDRENPNWREETEKNLQKLRSEIPV